MTTAKSSPSREEIFRTLPIPTALRIMILPAVTSQLIVLIYNMADTFYVGQTNNPYMVAGASLILPIFNISLCLAGLAGIGGGSLIARLLGTVRWLGFNIPMLFILNALFGMYGLVWSQVTADILTVTMSFLVYFKFRPALLKGKRGSAEAPAA